MCSKDYYISCEKDRLSLEGGYGYEKENKIYTDSDGFVAFNSSGVYALLPYKA